MTAKSYKTNMIDLLKLTQSELLETIDKMYVPKYTKVRYTGGIIFLPKDVEKYPLVCSHLDTINTHRNANRKLSDEDILINGDMLSLQPNTTFSCLGGDDRCGVYIALELMARDMPYAFGFFLDEEIGGRGSDALADNIELLDNVTALVGLDRRGSDQLALYGYDNQELNEIFYKQGYKEAMGTFTDASNIAGFTDLACINLSIGYDHEHTPAETIDMKATVSTLTIMSRSDVAEKLAAKKYLSEITNIATGDSIFVDITYFPEIIINDRTSYEVEMIPNQRKYQQVGAYVSFAIPKLGIVADSLDDMFDDMQAHFKKSVIVTNYYSEYE